MVTVLIIEDEAELLEEIVMMMRFEGFEAVGAANGEEGVRLAGKLVPDVIVSDIMLPELDGYGVLQKLQADPLTQHIPFIFLTAKSDSTHLREGMSLGADDYITKPFTRNELLAAIHTRLTEREAVMQSYQSKLDDLREALTLTLPHEFRTPLTSLVGFAELLVTDSETLDVEQVSEMAGMILTSGQRLRRHLENSWLYAQLEALKAAPKPERAQQPVLLRHADSVIRSVAQRIADQLSRTADLVVQAVDAPVAVSDESFSKIVEELVDNAFKFSESGTPVQVNAMLDGEKYVLRIADRGRGMTAEQIKESGAYVQFDRTFFEQQGVGLGLTLVRGIVRLHDGEVAITSERGLGTQITVTLPVGDSDSD